ncbi:MAG: metal-dependent phosphohydrolase [Gammaproteobacteria bacterium]|nr:metal-dependent phosphohydrolase [Gammaproteobacteria bacterium]MBU1731007.1 metal-dependent phosphohydrolase [Gammaproteobacteria bacterium]MBU1893667.1 metal-dependent phosphohydrolase [Gammaproteobacteria bacterium]
MSYIQTFTGRRFYPADPRPWDVDIHDIAHSLSHLCRFNGHTRKFYSVAQHSVLVSVIVPESLALDGLMHDAAEAYLSDITSPVKPLLEELALIEARIHESIAIAMAARYMVPMSRVIPPAVKHADLVMLATERRDLLTDTGDEWPCLAGIEPRHEQITAWDPETAKRMFLERFEELAG